MSFLEHGEKERIQESHLRSTIITETILAVFGLV